MSAAPPVLVRETGSAEETLRLGESLGRSLVGGVVVGLVGPLGAGKTQFVKGVAVGNGGADARQVTSPTYTLIHEYSGRLALYHVDAYRLKGPTELVALGFDELIAPDSAVIVEWADRVELALPEDRLWVELSPLGETRRRLVFRAIGGAARKCLDALAAGATETLKDDDAG